MVEVHDAHFAADTDDILWLAEVGHRGWVVLTKDDAIRTNELERTALMNAKEMLKTLRRFRTPFIARITASGHVSVLYDEDGKLDPPRMIK